MTSTEFTIGMSEGRNSSKVLKPPGGGSSDIFGVMTETPAPKKQNGETETDKQNKPNGEADKQNSEVEEKEEAQPTPAKTPEQPALPSKSPRNISTIFSNEEPNVPKRTAKKYVRRNPITGEEEEIDLGKNENDKSDSDSNPSESKCNGVSEAAAARSATDDTLHPPKPTSVRVRQPPGGKSSGIF